MNKNELRIYLKSKLKNNINLSNKECIDISNIIKDYFIDINSYIGIYNPLRNELELNNINFIKDKKLCLPFSYKNGKMVFRKINNSIKDELNILSTDGEIIDKSNIKVMIVPGLAYNLSGYRLGHGNGFYDKYLFDYKGLIIGTCFDECIINDHFEESHDLKVDYIVSEKRIIKIG